MKFRANFVYWHSLMPSMGYLERTLYQAITIAFLVSISYMSRLASYASVEKVISSMMDSVDMELISCIDKIVYFGIRVALLSFHFCISLFYPLSLLELVSEIICNYN